MNERSTKEFFRAALIRAFKTMCQAALSMLAVGMSISDVDWLKLLSVSAVAGVISILTSLATGLPEAHTSGEILIDTTTDDASGLLGLQLDSDVTKDYLEELKTKGHVNLRVRGR